MVQLRARFDHPTFSDQQIAESIVEILTAHNTLSMATVSYAVASYRCRKMSGANGRSLAITAHPQGRSKGLVKLQRYGATGYYSPV